MDSISLPDNRTLEIDVTGADGAPVLLFHHGTPGGVPQLRVVADAAHARGMRLVSYSRAGYGTSSRLAGRRVADVAADMQAVLAHVGADTCVTAGWSGGGPHALATAALMPDKVLAAISIAGVAPYHAQGLDFLAGMGEPNIEEFNAALAGEGALRPMLEQARAEMAGVDGPGVAASLAGLVPRVDLDALDDQRFADDLAAEFRSAFQTGVDGWLDDDLGWVSPWGFGLGDIQVPTFLWQGSEDLMVPLAHGHWLDRNVPGIVSHFVDGDGHLSLLHSHIGEMLDEARDAASR